MAAVEEEAGAFSVTNEEAYEAIDTQVGLYTRLFKNQKTEKYTTATTATRQHQHITYNSYTPHAHTPLPSLPPHKRKQIQTHKRTPTPPPPKTNHTARRGSLRGGAGAHRNPRPVRLRLYVCRRLPPRAHPRLLEQRACVSVYVCMFVYVTPQCTPFFSLEHYRLTHIPNKQLWEARLDLLKLRITHTHTQIYINKFTLLNTPILSLLHNNEP